MESGSKEALRFLRVVESAAAGFIGEISSSTSSVAGVWVDWEKMLGEMVVWSGRKLVIGGCEGGLW